MCQLKPCFYVSFQCYKRKTETFYFRNGFRQLLEQSGQSETTPCPSIWPCPITKAEVFYNVNYVNVNYYVKNSTVCKYLLFLQDFFFRLKPKCQYSWLFQKHFETHKTKQVNWQNNLTKNRQKINWMTKVEYS